MKLSGQVRKMKVEPEVPIQYFLNLNKESHSLNSYIGNKIKIKWEGIITCIECGRKTKKSLSIGICGEHGGEPNSIRFCSELGLNYVSCSPFRIPIARLAAAQVEL